MNTPPPIFAPPSKRDVARKALLAHLRRKRVGDRLPPIKQLARELNVGESNLMGAMQQLNREGIVYSRKRVGTYVASPASAANDAGHVRRLLAGKRIVLMHEASDGMIWSMIEASRGELDEQGATQTAAVGFREPQRWRQDCEGADLAILFNPPTPGSWRHLPDLNRCYAELGCPVTVVSTSWTRGIVGGFAYDLVGIDQEEAGRLAGERMRLAGHTSACFIGRHIDGGSQYTALSAARLRGFEVGLRSTLNPEHYIMSLGYSCLSGGVAVHHFMRLKNRPTAVFAATDALAVGFWIGAAAQGLRAGEDFDLLGVDGLALGRQQTGGRLTTVELPAREMGRAGARLAAQRLLHPDAPPQTSILPCRVCEGVTVKSLETGGEPKR